jgi:hypothetical protein
MATLQSAVVQLRFSRLDFMSFERGAKEGSEAWQLAYRTALGKMYETKIEDALEEGLLDPVRGKVDLLLTSPPFPLNRKKKYGNLVGDDYLKWLTDLAPRLAALIKPKGSIVLELGNAWDAGHPTMSLLPLKALMAFLEGGDLKLCQQFVCHNPARLPTPTQWVNVDRIRVKDCFTHVWWMSRTDRPKAHNKAVLVEYSAAMKGLLARQSYNAGPRPSEHSIGASSFLKDNGGAIPGNVLSLSNTSSNDAYRSYCKAQGLKIHPARMQPDLVRFFVEFLTNRGDLVLDPFGGSNTTGAVAESLGRRWISIEAENEYVEGSKGRFPTAIVP